MNHIVPHFIAPKRSTMGGDEEIVELLWHKGQVVMHSQNQRPKKSEETKEITRPSDVEDEMASWLHYPLDDNPLENYLYGTDLIPEPTSIQPIPSRPPVPPYRRVEVEPKNKNFGHFTRPKITSESRVSQKSATVGLAGTSSAVREIETCEMSVTSSGGSGATASMEKPPPVTDDRKRKGVDTDYHTERRRDRINEKMKALQELIPRCNKSDKASMLDEAIEYLKLLQMQVQMMSMGCNMVPMMFPGIQQYVPPMAMGMGMGMGMGMDTGMNRAMVPYPAILPGSLLPNPAAAAHFGQRFPVPGFNMSPVAIASSTSNQVVNMSDPMMNTLNSQNQQVPNFADPFQHHLGLHQTQLPLHQNQGGVPLIATKSSNNIDATNPGHKQTG